MATQVLGSLKDGDQVRSQVLAVARMEKKETRDGKPYLELLLGDLSGQCVARRFDITPQEVDFSAGDAVVVSGSFSQKFGLSLDLVSKHTGPVNPVDFIPSSSRSQDELAREVDKVLDSLKLAPLKALGQALLRNDAAVRERFLLGPGAIQVHHAYLGGLAEHSLAVAAMCDEDVRRYPDYRLARDLMVLGGLIHDLGKIYDYQLGAAIIPTRQLTLSSHLHAGARLVEEAVARITGFPEDLLEHLVHILLSHHGSLEHGSAVTPATLEAYLVYSNDYKDGKANRYHNLISAQHERGQEIGPRDHFLDTRLYAS